jgi:hypothetical protein
MIINFFNKWLNQLQELFEYPDFYRGFYDYGAHDNNNDRHPICHDPGHASPRDEG